MNGILQYISIQRYHCYIALQSKKFKPIDVLTKYWTHSDHCSSILYTCLHSRKWRNSASPLETLEPNSFSCGRFNTKDSSKKLRHVGVLFVNISITTRLAWFSLVEWSTKMATLEIRDTVSFVTIDWLPSCIAERKLMPTTQFEVNELEKNIGQSPLILLQVLKAAQDLETNLSLEEFWVIKNNMEDKKSHNFSWARSEILIWVLGFRAYTGLYSTW